MKESNEGSVATMIRVEDEENQTKRIKTEEIVKADEDRINLPGSDFISLVAKALSQHCNLKLKKFELYSSYGNLRLKTKFNDWIRYAISCNVEELILNLRSEFNLDFWGDIKLDQSFLVTSCITHMELRGCSFNFAPAISWKNLKTLCISYGKLNEETIKNILNGCPMLETLVLKSCYGYSQLDITSKSLKNLVFHVFEVPSVPDQDPDFPDDRKYLIKINAPYILSLQIVGCTPNLWNLLLLDVSSLVKANLNVRNWGPDGEIMHEGFILSLRHVKELTVGDETLQVFSDLEAKGYIFPPNMKYVYVPSP